MISASDRLQQRHTLSRYIHVDAYAEVFPGQGNENKAACMRISTLMLKFNYSIPTLPNPTSLKVVEDLVADLVYD